MATLVCFHAHPDDEVIATGGVMAKASAEGHRVVLVHATKGEHGEIEPGVLGPGERLADRRVLEVEQAAKLLGVHKTYFLGYVDSGMMGTPQNEADGSFWQADIEEAAGRLAAILGDERADVLTIYDANGQYGHPDHIQVHRVGARAAELAGTPRVYESTIDRDRMRVMLEEAASAELAPTAGAVADGDLSTVGSPSDVITTRVDITPWLDVKREAMTVHASQIGEESWFLSLPPWAFALAFGTEVFIRRNAPAGLAETDLLTGLA